MQKIDVDVEIALRWAYQHELLLHDGLFPLTLPSIATPGWVRMIDTGTVVDESREQRFPVGAGEPHHDALLLDFMVRALPDVRVDWREQRAALMGDMAIWLSDRDCIVSAMSTTPTATVHEGRDRRGTAYAHARIERRPNVVPIELCVRETITTHARLGNRPIWDMGDTRVQRSKPALVGRQTGKNRYTEGSACPLELFPPAHEIARARWEYAVWHQALTTLATINLDEIKLLAPRAPAQPWFESAPPPKMSQIRRDLTAAISPSRRLLNPKRHATLPQRPAAAHGPARVLTM